MKKIISILIILMSIYLVGCNDSTETRIDITEEMYLNWVNEIYTNSDEYIGKTVKIEGMYSSYFSESENITYNIVYRIGPGCCGNDGDMCGFEFEYEGKSLPKEKDWIEVEGTLDYYNVNGYEYLTIKNANVNIKDERGEESVYQ